ncbi:MULTISPECIES: succinate dehydrogenase, cytochrome b556 subunit [unclassified Pseudoxanthomonas]|jgi:succinate dehydrogenase / fumarate reductase cytochrome b subunit|uniref:succinate dehydrogenase, cytochrome b556 subunit n=1 Tax=unclassified Pseudoxanthomonas TaxID=2645906 RepID=UPI003076FBA7
MATPERPLSPHLQVYRWQIQMVTSILHRGTGIFLTFGSLLIAAGMLSLVAGPESWNRYKSLAGSWLGQLFLLAWAWSFIFHLINGIRHLLQDAGYGYSIAAFVRNSWIAAIGSLLLTAVLWVLVVMRGGLA